MCGFLGLIEKQAFRLRDPKTRVLAGLEWLRKRGPDSQKYWSDRSAPVHLGFARLAIVDKDDKANQPFFIERYRVGIVFNGEAYNYLELRNVLSKHYVFETESDTEVVLASYLVWGIDGLRRLRGTFSGAILDLDKRALYVFRDPVGKKPLYIYESSVELIFSSSVLAIVSACSGAPEIDEASADDYWRDGWIDPRRAAIKNCHPVLPGEVVKYDFRGFLQGKQSCRPLVSEGYSRCSGVDAQLRFLLKQSVARRLTNNPNPTVLLSGGIDSTVIAKTMRELGQCQAITLSSPLALVPDERYAWYAARKINVPLERVRIPRHKIADSVEWAFHLQDEPLGMISFFLLARLVAAAKEHGRILMTGDGGDEVFLGYGRAADWITSSTKASAAGEWAVGVEPPSWMSEWGQWVVRQQLLGHMFAKVDRAAAEQGVEIRCPLLDWDLLAWARSLSADQLLAEQSMKAVLKAQLAEWPKWFTERKKIGFAYRLRWHWALSNFSGLRERIRQRDCERFGSRLPPPLRAAPEKWSLTDIVSNFDVVWKLLGWSAFCGRLLRAGQVPPRVGDWAKITHA